MNYEKHYTSLIERAKTRNLDEYTERHHIIPRCIGGGDEKANLVDLTPEEHYVAHQLLLKIYPNHSGLIYAAVMMTVNRGGNRLYGWLRRKHAGAMSESQSGNGNSQYGTCWISNIENQQCIKIEKSLLDVYLSAGWIKKRIMNWSGRHICDCGVVLYNQRNFCSTKCTPKRKPKKLGSWHGRENEFMEIYKKTNSMNKSLILMGYKSSSGSKYHWAKALIVQWTGH